MVMLASRCVELLVPGQNPTMVARRGREQSLRPSRRARCPARPDHSVQRIYKQSKWHTARSCASQPPPMSACEPLEGRRSQRSAAGPRKGGDTDLNHICFRICPFAFPWSDCCHFVGRKSLRVSSSANACSASSMWSPSWVDGKPNILTFRVASWCFLELSSVGRPRLPTVSKQPTTCRVNSAPSGRRTQGAEQP